MLLDNLSDLFQRGLEDAWDCEHLLLRQLPRILDAASSPELKESLHGLLAGTKSHIATLEQIFKRLDRSPAAEKHEPIRVLLEECERMIGHLERSPLLDAALVFVMNQIEYCEVGLYRSLSGFAQTLGASGVSQLLDQALEECKNAVNELTSLAEGSLNRAAAGIHNAPPFALI
jgi:ferritin-like metal-binding protein YciE